MLLPDSVARWLRPISLKAEAESELRAAAARTVAFTTFAAFLAYYGLLCLRPDWGGDFQMYCAGIARLYRDALHPLHESLNVPGSQSTVYTPFLVGVAMLGKLFGTTPFRALQIAGVFNLVLFAGGACFLFARVSIHKLWWLPAGCFMFTTLCLRWLHFGWSSETSLTNFQYIQPYPSTFAWALAFIAFGLMSGLRSGNRRDLIWLVPVLSLLLSSHVLTASWVLGIVGLFASCASIQDRTPRPLASALLIFCAALVPVLLWPYSSFFGQSSLQGVKEGSPFGRSPLIEFPNLYLLAVPCFAYVWFRLQRHGFWVLGLLASLVALLVWRQLGISYGNRYAFFAAFFPQLIVAEVMAWGIFALLGPLSELPPERRFFRWDRPLLIVLLAVACTSWLPSPMLDRARQTKDYGTLWPPRVVLRRPSPHDAYYRQFAEVKPHVTPEDVVIMPVSRAVLDFASVTGASVVSTPLAMQVPDGGARFRAVNRFFDAKTSSEARLEIARKYGASKILVPSRHFSLLPMLTKLLGEPTYKGPSYAIFDVA